ncbi:MAG TPA: hypothetical protein VM867_08320 [Xanthobacteraceae bacterium]|nr:hypothetical protein [Xanthobacteraceae bacterium]
MSPKKTPKPKRKPMSKRAYLDALSKLGLTPSGKATALALGIGLRQCQRIAAGEQAVPRPVEKLLAMYLEHGIPDDPDVS